MTAPERTETKRSGLSQVGAVVGMLGLVAGASVVAIALDSDTPAGASGLEQFASCAELEAWTSDLQDEMFPDSTMGGIEILEEDASANVGGDDAPAPAADGAGEQDSGATRAPDSSGTGGTNTVVEGVDEIDVIDRVGDDRLLVTRNGSLALVDLTGRTVLSELAGLPYDARISAADGVVFAAGSSTTGAGIEVWRVRISGDGLVADGTWTSPGYLLDARRTGDRLHVVAVDSPFDAVPFAGGPVPCDQVWRPVAPATTAAATLVATLPATGPLAPTAATEITGSAGNLLVTASSVYVATESWSPEGTVTTGLHRFDVGTLTPTGSGTVPGSVAGPFALNEHEGTLRVATNAGGGGFVGRPIPVEGDVVVDDALVGPTPDMVGAAEATTDDAVNRAVPGQVDPAPPPADPEATTTTLPDATTSTTEVPETTTTTEAPATTTTEVPETTTTTEAPTTTLVEDPAALAEVFVLDTDGDLDLLGRTGRFGHDYETIHGVRFTGDVAYVVTFLQTDPFWVVDLADPAAPRVVGELQIPGFSGYLHPVGDGRVVGFGPDGNGSVAARLFDVANPAAPSVIDEVRLGDDSPVTFDHHAFVGLGGGQFAVPVNDYPDQIIPQDCGFEPQPRPLPEPLPPIDPGTGDGTQPDPGSTGVDVGEPVPICDYVAVGGGAGAVVLEVSDGRLRLVDRAMIESQIDLYAERVVLAPDGAWLVLSWDRLQGTDGSQIVLPAG